MSRFASERVVKQQRKRKVSLHYITSVIIGRGILLPLFYHNGKARTKHFAYVIIICIKTVGISQHNINVGLFVQGVLSVWCDFYFSPTCTTLSLSIYLSSSMYLLNTSSPLYLLYTSSPLYCVFTTSENYLPGGAAVKSSPSRLNL